LRRLIRHNLPRKNSGPGYGFINCCRLFEEGGNFCAGEVTEYNKRLEKITQQVAATEQTLSAELKTIEPKKVEQIAKIIRDFEDR